jgi:hypothetical protein
LNLDDIVDLKKLGEGGFNRTILIPIRNGFQIMARIPYRVTVPKYFTVPIFMGFTEKALS